MLEPSEADEEAMRKEDKRRILAWEVMARIVYHLDLVETARLYADLFSAFSSYPSHCLNCDHASDDNLSRY